MYAFTIHEDDAQAFSNTSRDAVEDVKYIPQEIRCRQPVQTSYDWVESYETEFTILAVFTTDNWTVLWLRLLSAISGPRSCTRRRQQASQSGRPRYHLLGEPTRTQTMYGVASYTSSQVRHRTEFEPFCLRVVHHVLRNTVCFFVSQPIA